MFDAKVYVERRKKLKNQLKSGLALFVGNIDSPMNYPANIYHFRQDSNFLYFFGLDNPGFVGLIDVDEDTDAMYGVDFDIADVIWMGPQPSLKTLAGGAGVTETGTPALLQEKLNTAIAQGRKIHYVSPYRAENVLEIEKLLGITHAAVKQHASADLVKAVVKLRSYKSQEEIKEIEKALDISHEMYASIMDMAKTGTYEREIVGRMEGILASYDSHTSFPTILSVRGETLHNHYHGNKLADNNMLLVDSGAESPEHYASDITRTFPVNGKFTAEQKDVYSIVLKSQMAAIEAIKPGVPYRDIHLQTAKIIASGLKDMGLMKGDVGAAVKEGAHALFFPHGLGHMIGLDVHDMEDLGENNVGYDEDFTRATQFGLAYLRLGRKLETGFVVTVEPGTYFIPELIDIWKKENKHADFINYDKVEKFKKFGGIRLEDDVEVTKDGYKVLGKPIPKTVEEIEDIMK
ncbi:MAG: aminopeptidase P family protein [bacterium]|nr:aminopeptidase P family protein [bacterium]